eukprot:symbB.v1.2.009942.t2/scaffold642.1/size177528/5
MCYEQHLQLQQYCVDLRSASQEIQGFLERAETENVELLREVEEMREVLEAHHLDKAKHEKRNSAQVDFFITGSASLAEELEALEVEEKEEVQTSKEDAKDDGVDTATSETPAPAQSSRRKKPMLRRSSSSVAASKLAALQEEYEEKFEDQSQQLQTAILNKERIERDKQEDVMWIDVINYVDNVFSKQRTDSSPPKPSSWNLQGLDTWRPGKGRDYGLRGLRGMPGSQAQTSHWAKAVGLALSKDGFTEANAWRTWFFRGDLVPKGSTEIQTNFQEMCRNLPLQWPHLNQMAEVALLALKCERQGPPSLASLLGCSGESGCEEVTVQPELDDFDSFWMQLQEILGSMMSPTLQMPWGSGLEPYMLQMMVERSMHQSAVKPTPRGLYLEFGVYQGESLNFMARLLKAARPPVKLYGFDSFQGLPAAWRNSHIPGALSFGANSFATEQPMVEENVRLIAGWFNETIPAFVAGLEAASDEPPYIRLLHIDCDMYSSAKEVLFGKLPAEKGGDALAGLFQMMSRIKELTTEASDAVLLGFLPPERRKGDNPNPKAERPSVPPVPKAEALKFSSVASSAAVRSRLQGRREKKRRKVKAEVLQDLESLEGIDIHGRISFRAPQWLPHSGGHGRWLVPRDRPRDQQGPGERGRVSLALVDPITDEVEIVCEHLPSEAHFSGTNNWVAWCGLHDERGHGGVFARRIRPTLGPPLMVFTHPNRVEGMTWGENRLALLVHAPNCLVWTVWDAEAAERQSGCCLTVAPQGFVPNRVFSGRVLPFFDQFERRLRFWNPGNDALVYADADSEVWVQPFPRDDSSSKEEIPARPVTAVHPLSSLSGAEELKVAPPRFRIAHGSFACWSPI